MIQYVPCKTVQFLCNLENASTYKNNYNQSFNIDILQVSNSAVIMYTDWRLFISANFQIRKNQETFLGEIFSMKLHFQDILTKITPVAHC